ncbi:hypothetical protein ACIP9H_33715 [Streptomyces sp. NPDC088732]|uniref:hypothetical protein n=1 Tax=Streptomyces sp. NPDC088732 TaxID=3365879 RepID=UPI0038266DA0
MSYGCRLHGPNCRVVWGYDQAHTDSQRPYTIDELADREEGPHFYAYPSYQEYQEGFRLWRALRWDSRLTYTEGLLATAVRLAPYAANLSSTLGNKGHEPTCPIGQVLSDVAGLPEGTTAMAAQLCNCTR